MTRCNLVLDGNEVKVRLQAERLESQTPVHVDWLRFTVARRNGPLPDVETLFPRPQSSSIWDPDDRTRTFNKLLAELPGNEFEASAVAMELGHQVAEALGDEFSVCAELRKGHDFYRHRWSIERNGVECGWVGFLASSDSPRQAAQARTIHVNLYGAACTFAAHGWRDRMADLVDEHKGEVTRIDLALDFFDGMPGGIDSVREDYMAGLMNVGGKKPKCNMLGDWCNNRARSFYFGSKEGGKQTNFYEKGDQLFGLEANSPWLRGELRYGNKLRELSTDMLRRPADFFAGASEWHARVLALADAVVVPEPVKCKPRIAEETTEAAAARVLRWVRDTAAPSVAFLMEHLSVGEIAELCFTTKRPGRLRGYSAGEVAPAAARAVNRFLKPFAGGLGVGGLQHTAA